MVDFKFGRNAKKKNGESTHFRQCVPGKTAFCKNTPEQRSGVVHIVEVRYTLQGL